MYNYEEPKKPFLRWNKWTAHFASKKAYYAFGILGFLMLVFIIASGFNINNIATDVEDIPGQAVCLVFMIYFLIVCVILTVYYAMIWSKNGQYRIEQATIAFQIATYMFPFLFIAGAAINNKIDHPEESTPETMVMNNPYGFQQGYGYNPAWGRQTRTFALTGQYTGIYSPSAAYNIAATSTYQAPNYGFQSQQSTASYGAQQPTGMYNVPPRGPQYGPQYGPQQPTGMYNVPPRGPQYSPQQPTGMYNVPPRGPQYGPQQPTGMYNAQPQEPQGPQGPQNQ